MLINKELLNKGFIIPRSTNSKFIKYLMDMGLKPIVKILDPQWNEQIGYLVYKKEDIVIETPDGQFLSVYNKHRLTSHVWIRPLLVNEIKIFLNDNPFVKYCVCTSIFDPYLYNNYLFGIDRYKL